MYDSSTLCMLWSVASYGFQNSRDTVEPKRLFSVLLKWKKAMVQFVHPSTTLDMLLSP